ncbi:hypothetical protein C8Q75DRAFT_713837 [Abortiporus biennis]|nr:hypothetical protein C8Q75DRAFT_713837 [Abortiporus biennis]
MRLFDFRPLSLLLLLVAQLILGGAVNRTIDDQNGDSVTGIQVQYSPAALWNQGSTCGGCATKADPSQAVDGTWHDGSRTPERDLLPLTFTLQFTGTAIYVYNIASQGILTDVTFTLDGQDAGHFTETFDMPVRTMYNVLIFSQDSMPMGDHTLVVSAFGPNYTIVLFDYAIYT